MQALSRCQDMSNALHYSSYAVLNTNTRAPLKRSNNRGTSDSDLESENTKTIARYFTTIKDTCKHRQATVRVLRYDGGGNEITESPMRKMSHCD